MKSLVQVDDPISIGGQIQVNNLVTALGHWLTTKVTEVIGRETIFVFLDTSVENTNRFQVDAEGRAFLRSSASNGEQSEEETSHRQEWTTGATASQNWTRHGTTSFVEAWRRCRSYFPKDQPPSVAQGNWRIPREQMNKSGETDQVVVHNKNMEFKGGTRSKQSEHTRWMDRHRLGRMFWNEAEYSLWTDRMVRSCVVIILVDTDEGDGAEQSNRSPRRCIGS